MSLSVRFHTRSLFQLTKEGISSVSCSSALMEACLLSFQGASNPTLHVRGHPCLFAIKSLPLEGNLYPVDMDGKRHRSPLASKLQWRPSSEYIYIMRSAKSHSEPVPQCAKNLRSGCWFVYFLGLGHEMLPKSATVAQRFVVRYIGLLIWSILCSF